MTTPKTPTVEDVPALVAHAKWLRVAADRLYKRGDYHESNTCEEAADAIEAHLRNCAAMKLSAASRSVRRGYFSQETGKYEHEDGVEFISSSIVSGRDYDRVVAENAALIERLRIVGKERDAAIDAAREGDEEDPTPWCSACGAMTKAKCGCGPIAENE